MTQWPERNVVDRITATDDEIRQAVAEAEVPPLLPALAYLTGDLSLLRDDLKPDPLLIGMEQGGLTEEQQATARALSVETLIKYRDAGSKPAPVPVDDVLLRIMEYAVGGGDMAAYLPLLEEELAYRGEDRRAPGWHVPDGGTDFKVVIIGAGMSGLLDGPPVAASRGALRGPREGPRCRRHLVGEQVSGLPRRQPQPQLQLFVRAASRLAAPLLDARRAPRVLPHMR